MKTKSLISALIIAVGMAGVAPSQADAKPKHVKKAIKKAHKNNHRHHHHKHKVVHKSYNYRPYRYDRPKHESESFGIYSTPGGGLGFHYSEYNTRQGYPYYW